MRPDGGSDRLEIVRIAPVEIDPQEVSIIESLAHPIGQRDLAIATVGVVQSNARAGTRAGCGAQRTDASRIATTIASSAVPYWRIFIPRSAS